MPLESPGSNALPLGNGYTAHYWTSTEFSEETYFMYGCDGDAGDYDTKDSEYCVRAAYKI